MGPQSSQTPIVQTIISTQTPTITPSSSIPSSTTSSAATSSTAAGADQLQNSGSSSSGSSSGLGTGGTVAIAVVIPVVGVALIVAALIFFWRRNKKNKALKEQRRKEVEEYGYNPNHDPTLPAVGAGADSPPEMSEDAGGYRGWGGASATAAGSSAARKASTNLSSANGGIGMAYSDDGRQPSPGSPPHAHTNSEGGYSGEPLVDGHNAAEGAAIGAATGTAGASGVTRGPSNASSTYSAAGHTEGSDDGAGAYDHDYNTNYSQYAPYRPSQTNYDDQPVIRDVSARRQTKLESPSVWPQQGNSGGISQNF